VAVGAVCCEPVSTGNSLLTGKLAGNFANSTLLEAISQRKAPVPQPLPSKFPAKINREIIFANREISGQNREISHIRPIGPEWRHLQGRLVRQQSELIAGSAESMPRGDYRRIDVPRFSTETEPSLLHPRISSHHALQVRRPRDLNSLTIDISSSMRRSRSASFWAKTRSCRLAIERTALSTSSECWINTIKCAPQGPYCPESQFFTVRSFAPVHPATVLIRVFLSLNALSNAEAISSAKSIAPSKPPPSPFELFGSLPFGKDLPFLGNDIPPSRSVQSGG
jgi:hypothetical protein